MASVSTSLVLLPGVWDGGRAPALPSLVLGAQGQDAEVSCFLMLPACDCSPLDLSMSQVLSVGYVSVCGIARHASPASESDLICCENKLSHFSGALRGSW